MSKHADTAARKLEGQPLDIPPGGGVEITPYPGYDVASPDKWAYDWDEKTRKLVMDRVHNVPLYRFFSPPQVRTLEALCAHAMPQDDRPAHERVPIAPWIDDHLYRGEGNGYRYEDMPEDREAYRQGLAGFEQSARLLYSTPFTALAPKRQDDVVRRVAEGDAPGDIWKTLPPARFFQLFMGDVISNYYAHPAAWSEMGFNGPSSPRGHIRLGLGKRDPWEAEEKRPRSSVELVRRSKDKGQGEQGGQGSGGGATH
ncbi:MAG TPA: gluconate 2-dehydrogenase subunit 3 family protein [Chloroflexia bacterium]|nr:gluconate 2-dehydrogenase subunit 3 family protein [Chloroflexia bacterium]